MDLVIVVNHPKHWGLKIPGVPVVAARDYLQDPSWAQRRHAKVFNLCKSYRYQSTGYYVSLLAEARGHRAIPNIATMQDMRFRPILRVAGEELDALIQETLDPIKSDAFTLSIYFGRNVSARYDRLSLQLYHQFRAPLLRATFSRNGHWALNKIEPIPSSAIPPHHFPDVVRFAEEYFRRKRWIAAPKRRYRHSLAILYNPADPTSPSNPRAIKKFVRAAEQLGLETALITRDDFNRLPEFDALFIRETTSVMHHTYRMARRAAKDGLVVVDDPVSIVRCTNKVFLAELLSTHGIPAPKTWIFNAHTVDEVARAVHYPCILKKPDSSFSQGVVKVDGLAEFSHEAGKMLEKSDLNLVQEFMPTEFDWRIGLFEKKPLWACRYFMAERHWQVVNWAEGGAAREGLSDAVPLDLVPPRVLKAALAAANLIGDGLYGVDLKETKGKPYIIEVNDNPSIDAGVEDLLLKDHLYHSIMQVFCDRLRRVTEAGVAHD